MLKKEQSKESKSEAMKRAADSDTAETKKLKAEVEELRGKLQLSAEEVAKLKSRYAALSKVADQVHPYGFHFFLPFSTTHLTLYKEFAFVCVYVVSCCVKEH